MGKKNKKQTEEPVVKVSARPPAGDTSGEVFLWLLAYSTLMFTLPFLGFYGMRNWLQESFTHLSVFEVNCYSVLTAVLVVNAVVAMYVLKAFRESDPPPLEEEEHEE